MRWGQTVLTQLDTHARAAGNESNAMSMAVSLDACRLPESDSQLRFAAYSSLLWGAQALWWEGVGSCAPAGSVAFAIIASVNNRVAQFATPLFLNPAGRSNPNARDWPYVVRGVYSTSSLTLPPLNGTVARKPGGRLDDVVQSMEEEMVAVELTNATAPAYHSARRLLLMFSTELSPNKAGAPTRSVHVRLRHDVTSTKPVEPDRYQGFADLPGSKTPPPGLPPTFDGKHECSLSWVGNVMPLQLPGGSAQLLSFTLAEDSKAASADAGAATETERGSLSWGSIGRRPPRHLGPAEW